LTEGISKAANNLRTVSDDYDYRSSVGPDSLCGGVPDSNFARQTHEPPFLMITPFCLRQMIHSKLDSFTVSCPGMMPSVNLWLHGKIAKREAKTIADLKSLFQEERDHLDQILIDHLIESMLTRF
jgi:hypothetical protein